MSRSQQGSTAASSTDPSPGPWSPRAGLVAIYDIGISPADQAAAEVFYPVVEVVYERDSVPVTSNFHLSDFDTIMAKTLAAAAVDRLLHHGHVVVT